MAFAGLYGIRLLPWEVSALTAMDRAYLKAASEKPSAADEGDPQQNALALKEGLRSMARNNSRKR